MSIIGKILASHGRAPHAGVSQRHILRFVELGFWEAGGDDLARGCGPPHSAIAEFVPHKIRPEFVPPDTSRLHFAGPRSQLHRTPLTRFGDRVIRVLDRLGGGVLQAGGVKW
jgi:hypothetical protein